MRANSADPRDHLMVQEQDQFVHGVGRCTPHVRFATFG